MDPKTIQKISSQVYRQFPEIAGVKPKVRLRPPSGKAAPPNGSPETYLLTFQGKADIGQGKSIPRLVRVVANQQGKILKISTSRWGRLSMKVYKLAEFLEIIFWKISIPLMSVSRAILAILQPVFEQLITERSKKVVFRTTLFAGSGLTLGFTLGILKAILH
jgi:hypothetical protein